VASGVVIAASCCLAFLGFSSATETEAKTTSALEYLSASANVQQDSLGLIENYPGLELTGISQDGSVIGYASDEPLEVTILRTNTALQMGGWISGSDTNRGISSFSRHDIDTATQQGCLVQFTALEQGCAIVIQRW
jgi:hypothetical protein